VSQNLCAFWRRWVRSVLLVKNGCALSQRAFMRFWATDNKCSLLNQDPDALNFQKKFFSFCSKDFSSKIYEFFWDQNEIFKILFFLFLICPKFHQNPWFVQILGKTYYSFFSLKCFCWLFPKEIVIDIQRDSFKIVGSSFGGFFSDFPKVLDL